MFIRYSRRKILAFKTVKMEKKEMFRWVVKHLAYDMKSQIPSAKRYGIFFFYPEDVQTLLKRCAEKRIGIYCVESRVVDKGYWDIRCNNDYKIKPHDLSWCEKAIKELLNHDVESFEFGFYFLD